MTDFFEPFDPSQYKESTFDPLPIAIYLAQVIEAEITVPLSGDGQSVKLVWQIIEGDYENRQVWQNIPYQHSNAQAQDIGRRHLKDLCVACGITTGISNPDPFKFIPCKIRVGIKKDKDGVYDDRNVVTRVWPASYQPPSASGSRVPKPAQAALASSPRSSLKFSSKSPEVSVEGMRFADYQSPNSPRTPPPQASSSITDEVRAMVLGLHTKSKLTPPEISDELAKINVELSALTIKTLLVVWGRYDPGIAGTSPQASSNGGTQPQASVQTPSQTPSQTSPQASSQASPQASSQASHQASSQTSPQASSQASPSQAVHGGKPPWHG
jgi:hypothetical protein